MADGDTPTSNPTPDPAATPTPAPAAAAPAAASAPSATPAPTGAISNISEIAAGARAGEGKPEPLPLPSFSAAGAAPSPRAIDLLSDVNLNVKIELGRTRMLVEDVLKLSEGAVVELDKLAGDPVDVYVNDRHVARGEVLVLNDNFCVRINEILNPTVEGAPRRRDSFVVFFRAAEPLVQARKAET
jgi:flagellar motor switch protein FliN